MKNESDLIEYGFELDDGPGKQEAAAGARATSLVGWRMLILALLAKRRSSNRRFYVTDRTFPSPSLCRSHRVVKGTRACVGATSGTDWG